MRMHRERGGALSLRMRIKTNGYFHRGSADSVFLSETMSCIKEIKHSHGTEVAISLRILRTS